eukprot:TRINITY_DN10406_c0_g1_i1.p1 TRINITY_DN10406_c0_g1~~TRINITY_DN10406_c0_g1_i1.p1  ORF type:complete len:1034 (+),score=277.95 TRINITY_DN10406_c0_g1_i1:158-3103(+)
MLHRNTHKITVILVYTALEWTLIVLLLLNSLFSYLIAKFAQFFGLKPPCLWCSRLDHVLEPTQHPNSYKDLICETHAAEISKLGYCSNHRKLAESSNMCEDCSSSRPCHGRSDGKIAFFSIVKEMGMISTDGVSKIEKGEKDLRCSCCGVSLGGGFYSPYLVFKPSWGVLDYAQKRNLIKEKGEDDESCNGFIGGEFSDPSRSDSATDKGEDEIRNGDGVAENQMLSDASADRGVEEMEGEDEIGSMESDQELLEDDSRISMEKSATNVRSFDKNESLIQSCCREDASSEISSPQLGEFSDQDRLIPIEMIDSMTINCCNLPNSGEDDKENGAALDIESKFMEDVTSGADMAEVSEEKAILVEESEVNTISEMLETAAEDEKFSVLLLPAEEESNIGFVDEVCNQDAVTPATQTVAVNDQVIEKDADEYASVEGNDMIYSEDKSESLMDRDICQYEPIDQPHIHEQVPLLSCIDEDLHSENYNVALDSTTCDELLALDSTTCDELVADEDPVTEQAKDLIQDGGDCCLASHSVTESVETSGQAINHHLASCSELNEVEEEKQPETPTFYMESIYSLHKRLLFERRESGTESLDGSVMSEIEGGEVLTVDRLKSVLKAEHKALSALYAELEEERSASAVAANQTMAMITRLQEEKAAMQMEALQYQRMMEEQSEYDQEALQLLNELMVKREKEKQELEKELELYRKKVLLYEAKEKRMMRKEKGRRSSGVSSASSSVEDSDELSIDLNGGDDVFFGMHESTQNTPVDEVVAIGMGHESMKQLSTLDESLADFEEERLSILEQLKALEEKLFTLADEEDHFEDIKSIEHYLEENGIGGKNCEFCSHHENGDINGSSEELGSNGIHYHERRNMGSKAKTLLPLFDAIGMENEEGLHEEQAFPVVSQNSVCKFITENKKLAIEEEVDNVYERLQALEADREFLKHCISSLKKGDKGMDLLQEILQHLRDLRNVELRVRNSGDNLS